MTVIDASRQFRERFVLTDSCVLSYPGATQVDELGGYTNLNVAQGQTPCRWVTFSKTELGKAPDREDSNSAATLLVSSDVYVAFGSIVNDSFRVVGVSRTGSDIYKRLELEVIRTETIIGAPIDPPEEPEEGELTSSIVLSAPSGPAEPGEFVTLPYTITTQNGLRPASVLILKNDNGQELDRTVLDSASTAEETASFLYKLPADSVGEASVYLDLQYSAKSFTSNTVSFQVMGELTSSIVLSPPIESAESGQLISLPFTITTENGLRPAAVLILKNETGDELDRTVLDSASDPSESASFLYELPSDAVGEMSVFLDLQYSDKSFTSNTVSFQVMGELTSSIVLSPPIESAESGQLITLPFTITTENGLRPAAVLILKNDTGQELDRTVLDPASDPSESASFLYELPSDVVGELSVYLDLQYSDKSFTSNTVSFEVIEQPIAIIDGTAYYEADLHIIETNGNGRIVTLPANSVLWVDWGDGSPPQTKPTLTLSLTSSMDEDTAREGLRFTRAIVGPEGIQNKQVTIRAIFPWGNAATKANLSWIKDVKQFGLNPNTGKRNQLGDGVRAFSQISAETLTALPGLDTSNLLKMNAMFIGATNFNQDLPDWDTSKVTQMPNIFQSATAFNGDITTWNVSKVTQLTSAFRFADSFNQDIGGWDVSSVTSWQETFREAFAFNQDIGGWQINEGANESRMREMFSKATNFNQDLSRWNVENCPTKPLNFDTGCLSWTLPRPVWGTDGSTTLVDEEEED